MRRHYDFKLDQNKTREGSTDRPRQPHLNKLKLQFNRKVLFFEIAGIQTKDFSGWWVGEAVGRGGEVLGQAPARF